MAMTQLTLDTTARLLSEGLRHQLRAHLREKMLEVLTAEVDAVVDQVTDLIRSKIFIYDDLKFGDTIVKIAIDGVSRPDVKL